MPHAQSFDEAEKLMQGLTKLRPEMLQKLLQACHSYKVRRLFLYLGEKLNYPWFKNIDSSKIDLGKGKRVIEKNGRFDTKYEITVPKDNFEDSYNEV